jgi:enoyl-CoA hydratase
MIDLTHRGPVAVVTLRRPEKRNALNGAMCTELSNVVRRALAGGTRAVVVTGSGTSFSAGADLDAVYSGDFREGLYDMLHTVAEAPVPVVAAVNGPAIGAGTQLAMAADLRVVAPGAVFAIPTAKIGLAVDPWTIRRFAHFAGHATARAVLLTGAQLGAEQAHERGFADRLGGLEDAIDWAGEIAALAPLTLAYSKQVLNSLVEPDGKALTDGDKTDNALLRAFEEVWSSEDFEEGRRARTERRAPRFEGR